MDVSVTVQYNERTACSHYILLELLSRTGTLSSVWVIPGEML